MLKRAGNSLWKRDRSCFYEFPRPFERDRDEGETSPNKGSHSIDRLATNDGGDVRCRLTVEIGG